MQTNGQDIEQQVVDLLVRAGGWKAVDVVADAVNGIHLHLLRVRVAWSHADAPATSGAG